MNISAVGAEIQGWETRALESSGVSQLVEPRVLSEDFYRSLCG